MNYFIASQRSSDQLQASISFVSISGGSSRKSVHDQAMSDTEVVAAVVVVVFTGGVELPDHCHGLLDSGTFSNSEFSCQLQNPKRFSRESLTKSLGVVLVMDVTFLV